MTVIAYKAGILAADTQGWHGEIRYAQVRKIHLLKDDRFYAASGAEQTILACRAWLDGDGERPAPGKEDDFGALILGPSGLESVTWDFAVVPIISEMAALGAHEEFLYGAMAAGASAEEAVRLAIQYCSGASGDVITASICGRLDNRVSE